MQRVRATVAHVGFCSSPLNCNITEIAHATRTHKRQLVQDMKRPCDCLRSDGKRAAVVRLNVGGRSFDATKETLSKCTYFDAYFEGRIDHSTDEQGRLFIDRNGDLFVYMLDFMRSVTLPSRKFIAQHKEALLGECAYFGLEFMA